MDEIRVVHVVHSLGVGGLENGVVNLVTDPRPGIRHWIVCLTVAGPFRQRVEPEVTVLELGKRPGNDVRSILRLAALLRRLRPDVVHSRNWATFDAVVAARLARVPVVVHGEHGRDIADPDGQHPLRNRWRRLLSPLVTRFVTVSDDLRRWLIATVGLHPAKVSVICNGVDTERFTPADPGEARAALGLQREGILVGTVGRLDPVKDQAGLIRAFADLAREHADVRLIVAGDGPCRADLERLASGAGLGDRALLLGERSDVPRVLATLNVFALPSVAEGISNTILEAMATGLPVIATRVGGNPELVEDGVNGLLVARRDPDALTAAMARYVDDPHLVAVHGKASRQRAVERFGLERMRDTYTGLYRDLAGARRRGV